MKRKPKIKHINLKSLRNRLWLLVSEYVRRSKADENGIVLCYTCGRPHYWTDLDCGHYIHKNCLDYTLDNLRPQCVYCNRRLNGNRGIFAEKLIREIGLEEVEAMRQYSGQEKKFTIIELDTLIVEFKEKLKELG